MGTGPKLKIVIPRGASLFQGAAFFLKWKVWCLSSLGSGKLQFLEAFSQPCLCVRDKNGDNIFVTYSETINQLVSG